MKKVSQRWRLMLPSQTCKGTSSDAKEIYFCGRMKHPNHVSGRQGCHNWQRIGTLQSLSLAETRWTQSGKVKSASGQSIIYSGQEDDGAKPTEGVAIVMTTD